MPSVRRAVEWADSHLNTGQIKELGSGCMGRPPLLRQRWGRSAYQPNGLGRDGGLAVFEPMEPRLLLAAQAAAANVFAQFEGIIASGRSTLTIPLNFSSNFTFNGGKSVLGVQVVAEAGNLDPALVQ